MKYLIILSLLLLTSCEDSMSLYSKLTEVPVPSYSPLSWEKDHPERKAWSDMVFNTIKINLKSFNKASDLKRLCSNFDSLTEMQKINTLGELISAMSFYESSWNPKSSSVDVGNKTDKNTWSVGLMQVSVTDQKNYGFKTGYTYDDLMIPPNNLDLAITMMAKIVEKRRKLILVYPEKGVYWAVLYDGGKYSKVPQILKMVKQLGFCK